MAIEHSGRVVVAPKIHDDAVSEEHEGERTLNHMLRNRAARDTKQIPRIK